LNVQSSAAERRHARLVVALVTLIMVTIDARLAVGAINDDALADAQRLLATGAVAKAMARLEEAAAASPKDPRPTYLLGTVREDRAGELSSAIKSYEDALSRDPDHAPSHYRLGRILFNLGKVQEASDHLRAAVKADPKLADAHLALGFLLERIGHGPEARNSFRTAARLRPKDATFRLTLGQALWRNKELAAGTAELRAATRLQPSNPNGWTQLGLILIDAKDLAGARQALKTAIKLEPNAAMAWQGMGVLERQAQHLDEAEAAFRRATRFMPADGALAGQLCDTLASRVPPAPDALAECQSALAIYQGNAATHLHVARLRVEAGDCAGARPELEAVERFVKAGPTIQNARRALVARCQSQASASPAGQSTTAVAALGSASPAPAPEGSSSDPPGLDGATPRSPSAADRLRVSGAGGSKAPSANHLGLEGATPRPPM